MAEAILRKKGGQRFTAYSAGSQPVGFVREEALAQIRRAGLPAEGLRSKSWDEFTGPAAPQLNFIFTVCDHAAEESCPYWPGQPMTAHWGVPDPAAVGGSVAEVQRAYSTAFSALDSRIRLFLSLPLETLDALALQKAIQNIGNP
jgi:arsenate reductase (thioredoxin)